MTLKKRIAVKLSAFPHAPRRMAILLVAAMLTACATLPPSSPVGARSESVPVNVEQQPAQQPQEQPAPRQVSKAEETALRSLIAQQDRLYRVAAPLLINNTSLCKGNVRNLLGFTAKTKYSYSSAFVDAAQGVLGLDDRLMVVGILPGSGAARVGVRPGDVLLSVENTAMPKGPDAERQAASVLSPLVGNRTMLKLGLIRDGRNVQANVRLTPACAFGIELGNANHINSYADGRRVLVTRGLFEFTQNDTELAYVVARDMAHNALSHARRRDMTATIGDIIDNLVRIEPDLISLSGTSGIQPYSADFDVAADTLALYMVARAGYNLDGALAFWQRLANQYPASVLNSHTSLHPSTAKRWNAIQRTVTLIAKKKSERRLLLP